MESILDNLDYDVSDHIYRTYYPDEQSKINKNKLNEQFKEYLNNYLNKECKRKHPWGNISFDNPEGWVWYNISAHGNMVEPSLISEIIDHNNGYGHFKGTNWKAIYFPNKIKHYNSKKFKKYIKKINQ